MLVEDLVKLLWNLNCFLPFRHHLEDGLVLRPNRIPEYFRLFQLVRFSKRHFFEATLTAWKYTRGVGDYSLLHQLFIVFEEIDLRWRGNSDLLFEVIGPVFGDALS